MSKSGVRGSRDADLAPIGRIYAHYVENTLASFEEQSPGPEELAHRRSAVLAAGLPYLVAERDGEIAGFAYASPYRSRAAYRLTVEHSVYVAPGQERHGIGRALLSAVIDSCTKLGYRQMIAVIGDSANKASIQFHARMEFQEAGIIREVGFKFGRPVDVVIMQRSLAAKLPRTGA